MQGEPTSAVGHGLPGLTRLSAPHMLGAPGAHNVPAMRLKTHATMPVGER